VDVTTENLFAGKTVIVLFARCFYSDMFNPSPGYNELARVFKENGVDDIVCISVNDTFVMNE